MYRFVWALKDNSYSGKVKLSADNNSNFDKAKKTNGGVGVNHIADRPDSATYSPADSDHYTKVAYSRLDLWNHVAPVS